MQLTDYEGLIASLFVTPISLSLKVNKRIEHALLRMQVTSNVRRSAMENTTKNILVNQQHVLELLGNISRTTLWRLRREHGFPEPSHRRYHLENVMRWIEAHHRSLMPDCDHH